MARLYDFQDSPFWKSDLAILVSICWKRNGEEIISACPRRLKHILVWRGANCWDRLGSRTDLKIGMRWRSDRAYKTNPGESWILSMFFPTARYSNHAPSLKIDPFTKSTSITRVSSPWNMCVHFGTAAVGFLNSKPEQPRPQAGIRWLCQWRIHPHFRPMSNVDRLMTHHGIQGVPDVQTNPTQFRSSCAAGTFCHLIMSRDEFGPAPRIPLAALELWLESGPLLYEFK